MTSLLKECIHMNDEYDRCCREYYRRNWSDCPTCGKQPMLGTHVRPVSKSSEDFVQYLTMTCQCGTFSANTMNMMKLIDFWNAHCYTAKVTQ